MNQNNPPLVTVFTLIYNTGIYAIEAIESVKKQSHRNIEHIIIDDASTDDSPSLVENWIKQNKYDCVFVRHQKNQGVCKSLNHVLDLASGEYLIGCCDDVLEKYAIETMVLHFLSLPSDYKIVYGDVAFINEKSEIIFDSYFKNQGFDPNVEIVNFRSYLENTRRFPTFGTMYKKDVFSLVGNFDGSLKSEDVDMHLRILYKYKCSFCGKRVGYYRRHPGQISQNANDWFISDRISIYSKWVNKLHGEAKKSLIKNIESLALRAYKEKRDHELSRIYSMGVLTKKLFLIFVARKLKINYKFILYFFKVQIYLRKLVLGLRGKVVPLIK